MSTLERARGAFAAHGGDVFVGVLIATAVLERVLGGHSAASVALAATWGLPLLARRRFPVLAPSVAMALVAGTILLVPAVAHETGGELLLLVTSVWMLVAQNPLRRAVWGLPALGIVALAGRSLEDAISTAVIVLGSIAAATVYRRDVGEATTLQSRVEELEATRGPSLQAAAAAERGRIARELHDIVAHSVSVMTVQAGAARMQLSQDLPQALSSLGAVEEASDMALAELDRLLGLLGKGEDIHGLADAGLLAGKMREAGLDVRLAVEGVPRPLGGGLDLALYRILQEAFTNARRHAGPVPTDVEVRYEPEEVRLRVVNPLPRQGAAGAGQDRHGHGHGLVGMRERLAVYDGQLEAGIRDGSFVVDVRVPAP